MASISASDTTAQPEKKLWYRGTLFNACIIGGVGFLAPGLWNAMNSLGAGGAQSPFLINAANALVFGLMGFLCLFGGPIANRIGLNWTLMLGAVGYPLYSAALYTNNRYGNVWFVLLGSVFCGLSAGLFWASEGAVALGYPEPTKRGRYMNIWLWFRTGGPLLGGAIVLGLNHSGDAHKKGKVGSETYLIFVALQCLAVPVAYWLTPPSKVQRNDGSKVKIVLQDSWRDEMKELWKVCKRKEILLLLPVFWAAYFNQYSGNFKTYYFGVRARALMGFVSYFASLLSSAIISRFLDYRGLSVRNRIKYSFFYVIVVHIAAWVYCWVIQEKYTKNPPMLDWADKGFVEGFFVILLWGEFITRRSIDAPLTTTRILSTMSAKLPLLPSLHHDRQHLRAFSTVRYPPWPGEFLPSRVLRHQHPRVERRKSPTCREHDSPRSRNLANMAGCQGPCSYRTLQGGC
ncbi:unnamed protein product [Penicillium salamii]|nr:unnamed protein product [Penicillium salamii]CAG8409632.1 unnamed protein product [Penicillium salamii]